MGKIDIEGILCPGSIGIVFICLRIVKLENTFNEYYFQSVYSSVYRIRYMYIHTM